MITELLDLLICKGINFIYNKLQKSVFQQLKVCIMTVPMLEIYDNLHDIQQDVQMDANT